MNYKLSKEEKDKKKNDYEKKVADLFIEGIKQNKLPWQKPWSPNQKLSLDYNIFTMSKDNKPVNHYKGLNGIYCEIVRDLILHSDDPRWCTFSELQKFNENKEEKDKLFIKKGSKGITINFFKLVYFDKDNKIIKTDDDEKVPENAVKYKKVNQMYTIFNSSQIGKYIYDNEGNKVKDNEGNYLYEKGFPPIEIKQENSNFKPIIEAEELIKKSCANIIHDQPNRNFYSVTEDKIHLVPPEYFKSNIDYYDTLLHELTHWTGHPKRLNRVELNKYSESKQWRAKEELIAEIGGFFLARECNFVFQPTKNNISYVDSWVSLLSDKPEAIFEACQKASKSTNFIIDIINDKVNLKQKNTENEEYIITVKKNKTH